jgi:hypothetical protein
MAFDTMCQWLNSPALGVLLRSVKPVFARRTEELVTIDAARTISDSFHHRRADVLRCASTECGSRATMTRRALYLRMARRLIVVSRRQPVCTDAVSYTRFVMRKAVAEDARDGEH